MVPCNTQYIGAAFIQLLQSLDTCLDVKEEGSQKVVCEMAAACDSGHRKHYFIYRFTVKYKWKGVINQERPNSHAANLGSLALFSGSGVLEAVFKRWLVTCGMGSLSVLLLANESRRERKTERYFPTLMSI